jgi:hypothetical protein
MSGFVAQYSPLRSLMTLVMAIIYLTDRVLFTACYLLEFPSGIRENARHKRRVLKVLARERYRVLERVPLSFYFWRTTRLPQYRDFKSLDLWQDFGKLTAKSILQSGPLMH